MDAGEESGGLDSAVRPGELVPIALWGRTGVDVAAMLRKMRVDLDAFEVSTRADEYARVYARVDLKDTPRGATIPREKMGRALNLSRDKHCSVSALLKKTAEIISDYRTAETG